MITGWSIEREQSWQEDVETDTHPATADHIYYIPLIHSEQPNPIQIKPLQSSDVQLSTVTSVL